MQTIMVYSESGGATKTTTAVSLAMSAALTGRKVLLVDLDPRAAATKWLGVEPKAEGYHVGAILANEDPTGWAEDIAVPSHWTPQLRVIPSARSVSNRESDRSDHAELRLRMSLDGLDEDVVVIDCPNRQGGPLTQSALTASDTVIYAAAPTGDGIDGYEGARKSVQRFKDSRRILRITDDLEEAGIVCGGVSTVVISRIASASIRELDDTGLLLAPLVPHRTIVQEVRMTNEWYGNYTKGEPVADAYRQLAERIIR
jgi:chromosome partitioning protein